MANKRQETDEMNLLNLLQPHKKPLHTMSPAKLWEILKADPNSMVIIDLRPANAYVNGHIPHAISQPLMPQQQCMPSVSGKTLPVIFYSEEEMPAELLEAASANYGRRSIFALDGGWLGWIRAGYPMTPLAGSLLSPGQFVDGMDNRLVH